MSQTKKRRRFIGHAGIIDPELVPLNGNEYIGTPPPTSTIDGYHLNSPPVLTLGSQQQQQLQRSKPRRIVASTSHLTLIERLNRAEQHYTTNDNEKNDPSNRALNGSLLDLQAYQMVPDALEARLSAATSNNSLLSFRQRTPSIDSHPSGPTLLPFTRELSSSSSSPSSTPPPSADVFTHESLPSSPFITTQKNTPATLKIPTDAPHHGTDTSDISSIHATSPATITIETTMDSDCLGMDTIDEIDVTASRHKASPIDLNQSRIDINHEISITTTDHEAPPVDPRFDPMDDTGSSCLLPNDIPPPIIETNLSSRLQKLPWIVEDLEDTTATSSSSSSSSSSSLWSVRGYVRMTPTPRKKTVRLSRRDSSRLPKRKILVKENSDWKVTTTLYPS